MAGNQGTGAGDSSIRRDFATLKRDVDGKFEQMMATSVAQSAALADIRSMFCQFLRKSDVGDNGSPSITQSALGNQESHGLNDVAPASLVPNSVKKILQRDTVPGKKSVAAGEKGDAVPGKNCVGAREKGAADAAEDPTLNPNVTAEAEEVTLPSDSDMTVKGPAGSSDCTALGQERKIERKKSPEAQPALLEEGTAEVQTPDSVAETEKALEDISSDVNVEEPGGALSSNPIAIDATDIEGNLDPVRPEPLQRKGKKPVKSPTKVTPPPLEVPHCTSMEMWLLGFCSVLGFVTECIAQRLSKQHSGSPY